MWESRDAFDRFVQERIVPVTMEVGLQAPQMSYYDVHCTMTGAPTYG